MRPLVTVWVTNGSTTCVSSWAAQSEATRSAGHGPRGSHSSRTPGGRSIRRKNDARLAAFSSVGRKLAGHWNKMAEAPSVAAQAAVTRHALLDHRAVAEGPRPGPLVLGQRPPQAAVGGAGGGVGDELPRLDRELEVRRNAGTPAAHHRLGRRLVERLLHLDDGEPARVLADGDREAAEADLDGAHGRHPRTNSCRW